MSSWTVKEDKICHVGNRYRSKAKIRQVCAVWQTNATAGREPGVPCYKTEIKARRAGSSIEPEFLQGPDN